MRTQSGRVRALTLTATLALVGACAAPLSAQAARGADPDQKASATTRSALGNGLSRLLPGAAGSGTSKRLRAKQRSLAITDASGRVLIDLTPTSGQDRAAFRTAATAAGLDVTAVAHELGTLEGFAAPAALQRLASLPGTGTIAQVPKPRLSAGSVQSQGVALQRVDKVLKKGIDGRGITIGVLSDSYDAAELNEDGDPTTDRAADDVASGDLPGTGNAQYPQPVVVIQDEPRSETATDEGRAMLQILHDMAPAAKLCFATADFGEVGFANNIRALADRSGPCRADIVVDDIGYFSEPYFSDGVIGDAVDDVAAQGVQYFSSAGNGSDEGGWGGKVRLVGAAAAADAGLDLSDVDPALYDGGFEDVDPGKGVDVAQTVTLGPSGGLVDLQWDDPFDVNGATYGDPYFSQEGELTADAPKASLQYTATADQVGKTVEFKVDGVPSGTVDLILDVTAPDGTVLASGVDTGSSPEVFDTVLRQAGTYTIGVSGYNGATGPFVASVRPVLSPSRTTTDFNVLFFTMDGQLIPDSVAADQNRLTGRPVELAFVGGDPAAPARQVQMVITRSGTGSTPVTSLRATTSGRVYFTEYDDPFAITTFGHPTAAGAISVAAQNAFKPYKPEYFTSVGGRLPIYFDSSGNRYAKPQTRTSPLITAADGVNTTFFVADSAADADATPNFYGTSAAAPSAAGIAALVLQKHGGGRSVSPAAMRTLLSRSTYAHDLDPFSASGSSKGLTISAFGADNDERRSSPGTLDDPGFFRLSYSGSGRIRSVTLDGATAAPTALGPNGRSAGMVFDPRPFDPNAESMFQRFGFPFTSDADGNSDGGPIVKASFSGTSGKAVAGQYRRMTLTFPGGLRKGQSIRFGVDRDLAQTEFGDASQGNGADLLGGGVFVPQNSTVKNGLKFTATLTNGKRITGYMQNKIGSGYSPVDGYGLIDAEKAVLGR